MTNDQLVPDARAATPAKALGEWGIALGLFVMSGITIADGVGQPASTSASGIGAGAAPIAVGSLMAVLGVVLVIQLLRGRRGEPEVAEGDIDLGHTKWIPLAVCAASLLFFVFTVDLLGYIPVSIVMFWAIAWAMGARRHLQNLIIAVVLSVAVYLSFTQLLQIPLPAGFLDGVL